MDSLANLIKKGNDLLSQVENIIGRGAFISGAMISDMKSLHVQGRFLLRKIDRMTSQEYSNLFSETVQDTYQAYAWDSYLKNELAKCVGILKSVGEAGIEDALDRSVAKIFISHGKFGPAFTKLEAFIRALGCIPVYDVQEPTEGKSINEHVESLTKQSDFFVILATVETTNAKGDRLPTHNVIIEYDRLIQSGVSAMIVLLEEGCKMPSMVQDTIWVSFSNESMDQAFTKFVAELRKHDLL